MPNFADEEMPAQVAAHLGGLGSPAFWASVVGRQLARIEALQAAYASILEAALEEGTPIPTVGDRDARIHYPAEMTLEAAILVVAMYDVSRFARSPALASARAPEVRDAARKAQELAPQLRHMRDLVEHASDRVPKTDETPFRVAFARQDDLRGELRLHVGDDVIDLKATAAAVVELGRVIDRGMRESLTE